MFVVILFIFLGILLGYLLRTKFGGVKAKAMHWQGRIVTWLIWLLLFLLGIEVGSNDRIISALPTLGVEALVLSVAATLGSCLLAWGLWKMVRKTERNEASSKETILKELYSEETTLKGGAER